MKVRCKCTQTVDVRSTDRSVPVNVNSRLVGPWRKRRCLVQLWDLNAAKIICMRRRETSSAGSWAVMMRWFVYYILYSRQVLVWLTEHDYKRKLVVKILQSRYKTHKTRTWLFSCIKVPPLSLRMNSVHSDDGLISTRNRPPIHCKAEYLGMTLPCLIVLPGVLVCSWAVLSVRGLYTASDDVVELNPSNFNREVVQSDSLWLVEFYAPWWVKKDGADITTHLWVLNYAYDLSIVLN